MIQMFIGDTEVLCDREFTISEEVLATSSTILNNCFPKEWDDNKDYYSNFYFPKDYSICRILKDDVLIFAGIVKNSGNISLRPEDPKYCNLQILGFKTLLSEGETLDFVISEKTVTEAIAMVVDAVKDYGFTLGTVSIFGGDDVIGAYSTLNKSAYDVFQYLADITGSKWFTRLVDENTVAIDFYDPTLMPTGVNIDYTRDFFETNNVQELNFSFGTRDYRNKQVMLSDEVYGNINYTETIIANGYATSFTTTTNIGVLVSITVDGESVTIATNDDKDLGIEADFYYTPGENTIETENSYIASSVIVVTYTPLIKGRQIVYNNDEIARINSQLNRKGTIARYETRNDVLDSTELDNVGQSYIKYKGSAEIILTLTTKGVDLYDVGQVAYFNAPIDDLAQDYMVKSKSTNIIATGTDYNVWYTYQLSSNFNSENAINYFDNQRNKANGNISSGSYITRNIDINTTANIIWSGFTVAEIGDIGDNILDSTLDSPFNN